MPSGVQTRRALPGHTHAPPSPAGVYTVKLDLDIQKTLTSGTRSFTLSVQLQSEHQRIVIVGASGSGKSLTLQALAGLLRPDTGHIRLDGDTLFEATRDVWQPPQARRLAYVFQDYALFPHLTVYQNVAFALSTGWRNPPRHAGPVQWPAPVARWLDIFGLAPLASQYPSELSGGQRQRTALARALVTQPRALPPAAVQAHLRPGHDDPYHHAHRTAGPAGTPAGSHDPHHPRPGRRHGTGPARGGDAQRQPGRPEYRHVTPREGLPSSHSHRGGEMGLQPRPPRAIIRP